MPAICVVVDGPSAVGKSTLVTGLQDRSPVPLLRFGVDELYRMIPDQWAGGTPDARHAERGFSYGEEALGRIIRNGPDAVRMLEAMSAGVLGMLRAGHDVVVDGEAYESAVTTAFHHALREAEAAGEIELTVVELSGGSTDLLDRQSRHAHPNDLALSQAARGPLAPDADLRLDTTGRSAVDVLDEVWGQLVARHARLGSVR